MIDRIYTDELPDRAGNRKVRYDWHAWAKLARAEPGMWVKVASSVNRHATTTVNRKESMALRVPDGRFEASIRNGRGKTGELWMRFVVHSDAELAGMEEE